MKLQPEDLIDVISNNRMILNWLSKPAAKKAFDDAVFETLSDYSTRDDRKPYLDITNNPNNPAIDPIVLAEIVHEYLDTALSTWKSASTTETAALMVASLPLFVEMSKYLPHVNPKDKYDYAFRGTEFPRATIKKFVQSSKPSDWKSTKIGGYPFMVYNGPEKNKITYKPHRDVQSWSVSEKSARGFGSVIVTVPLDDTFFFDPSFMGRYGYEHEKETVHFGKEPMKTALLVPKNEFIDYRVSMREISLESLNESQEVQDDEGTLTLPGI